MIRVVVAGADRLARAGVASWSAWRPAVGVVVGAAFSQVDVPVLAVVPDAGAARDAIAAGARGVVAPSPTTLGAAVAAVAAGLSVYEPTWAEALLAVRPVQRGDTLTSSRSGPGRPSGAAAAPGDPGQRQEFF